MLVVVGRCWLLLVRVVIVAVVDVVVAAITVAAIIVAAIIVAIIVVIAAAVASTVVALRLEKRSCCKRHGEFLLLPRGSSLRRFLLLLSFWLLA